MICLSLFAPKFLKYTNGNNLWNADSLGNHRAVVKFFNGWGDVAHVKIEWRRRDQHPELKDIMVLGKNGRSVQLVGYQNITRESGGVFFKAPVGKYFVYYMPYKKKEVVIILKVYI